MNQTKTRATCVTKLVQLVPKTRATCVKKKHITCVKKLIENYFSKFCVCIEKSCTFAPRKKDGM